MLSEHSVLMRNSGVILSILWLFLRHLYDSTLIKCCFLQLLWVSAGLKAYFDNKGSILSIYAKKQKPYFWPGSVSLAYISQCKISTYPPFCADASQILIAHNHHYPAHKYRNNAVLLMTTITVQLLLWFASLHQTGNDLQEDPITLAQSHWIRSETTELEACMVMGFQSYPHTLYIHPHSPISPIHFVIHPIPVSIPVVVSSHWSTQ